MNSKMESSSPKKEGVHTLVPRTIPLKEHAITPTKIDRDALFVLKKLNKAGFKGYLVGGGVRDLYLGKTPKDFDISTDARPGQLRKLFPNSNTIGRRFRLVQVFFRGGKTIEVSTLRSLSEHDIDGPEAVLAPNNTFGTLSEDARRRDLTINSLFYEITDNTIIDYVNGIDDLDNAIIRIVGDPIRRIRRDPVRMLRAIRHGARNNFTIEENTWQAITSNCDKLTQCPPSRLRDEILKDLYSGSSAPWFGQAFRSGIFTVLFPLYKETFSKCHQANINIKSQLKQIFTTIDRLNSTSQELSIHRQPDFFLFALFLTPWAESRFHLFSVPRKGGQLFQISKQIRLELDQTIGISLNLRRSLRQEIVSLLTNLSLLIHNETNNNWPKWLRKKSYFPQTALFYHFYTEATTGKPVPHHCIKTDQPRRQTKRDLPKKTSRSRAKTRPALATQTIGGIFGLKK